jgi:hypothetical protein
MASKLSKLGSNTSVVVVVTAGRSDLLGGETMGDPLGLLVMVVVGLVGVDSSLSLKEGGNSPPAYTAAACRSPQPCLWLPLFLGEDDGDGATKEGKFVCSCHNLLPH